VGETDISANSLVTLLTIVAGVAAAATLILYVAVEILIPIRRRHRLRHPCSAEFLIVDKDQGLLDHAIQDDVEHRTKELVLSANSVYCVEIIYKPRLEYFESKIAFGCESDSPEKPYAFERFNRYIEKGKARWIPGCDLEDSLTRKKLYIARRDEPRNVGSEFIVGFKVQTRGVGTFPMNLYFITNEIEGKATLQGRRKGAIPDALL